MRLARLLACLAALGAATAFAQEPPTDLQAEHVRLQGEIKALAQRSAWQGVDRGYRQMIDQGMVTTDLDHLLGAQAAMAQSDALLAIQRLKRIRLHGAAATDEEGQQIRSQAEAALGGLLSRYGLVSIQVPKGPEATLVRDTAPFASDEQEAIAKARTALAVQGTFQGLLPTGEYQVAGRPFTVRAGGEWQAMVTR